MIELETRQQAERLLQRCRERNLTIATVESCTGGLISGTLTAIPGSSDVFERGFVTYSNVAKREVLGVPDALLKEHGAVSEACARAMVEGAMAIAPVDLIVAVTGISGPGGGSRQRPVGLVHFAILRRGEPTQTHQHVFAGDRDHVRDQTVAKALTLLDCLIL